MAPWSYKFTNFVTWSSWKASWLLSSSINSNIIGFTMVSNDAGGMFRWISFEDFSWILNEVFFTTLVIADISHIIASFNSWYSHPQSFDCPSLAFVSIYNTLNKKGHCLATIAAFRKISNEEIKQEHQKSDKRYQF